MASPEVKRSLSIFLKSSYLSIVIGAGIFWASAGVDSRPRYKDQQTLIGATVWSQIVVPLGLFTSKLMGEKLDKFVEAYFVASGVVLLFATGIILIVGEYLSVAKSRQIRDHAFNIYKILKTELKYDNIHLGLGILCIIAGCFMFADFIILLV